MSRQLSVLRIEGISRIDPDSSLSIEWTLLLTDTAANTQVLYNNGTEYRRCFAAGVRHLVLLQMNSFGCYRAHFFADYTVQSVSPGNASLPVNGGYTDNFLTFFG